MYTFPTPVMKNKILPEATLTGWPRCCQLYVCKLYLVVTPLTSLYTCFCLPLALLKFNSLCSTSPREGQSCCKSSGNGLRTDIVILLFKAVEKGNFYMPPRAREVFMVGKEDLPTMKKRTFALLHCEGLWLNSVVLSVLGCPLFMVESEKKIPVFEQCDGDDSMYALGIYVIDT